MSAGAGVGISVRDESGNLLKVLASGSDQLTFGLHQLFGWISESGSRERLRFQRRNGRGRAIRLDDDQAWFCRLRLDAGSLQPLDSCRVEQQSFGSWKVLTPRGTLNISRDVSSGTFKSALVGSGQLPEDGKTLEKSLAAATLLAALLLVFGWLGRGTAPVIEAPVMEPVMVKILPENSRP